jgi:hypothetical protein
MAVTSSRECFNLIAAAVQQHIDRLLIEEPSGERLKGQKIRAALDRLFRATIEQNPEGAEIPERFTRNLKLDSKQVAELNLTTVDAMLDAQIDVWESGIDPWTEGGMEFNGRRAGYHTQISLRRALNIARHNIFNSAGGTWGPLWGKADALEQTERDLGIDS